MDDFKHIFFVRWKVSWKVTPYIIGFTRNSHFECHVSCDQVTFTYFSRKKNVIYARKLLLLESLLYKERLKVLNILDIDGVMSTQAHTTSLFGTPIAKSIVIETK